MNEEVETVSKAQLAQRERTLELYGYQVVELEDGRWDLDVPEGLRSLPSFDCDTREEVVNLGYKHCMHHLEKRAQEAKLATDFIPAY